MEEFENNLDGEFPMLLTSTGQYKTELTEKYKNRKKWVKFDPLKIYSVLPGTVIDVFVKNGQKVQKGETIMILEAMKMQNQILMPIDGKIKKVHIKPDDTIPKNFVMIELA